MNSALKNEPQLPRLIALALLVVILLVAGTGCVSSRYKDARKGTPPPQPLNVAFAPAPLEVSLATLITYNGPGSWKRNAFWDEYVVTLRNPGPDPLIVSSAELADVAGKDRVAGGKPWVLEKESKTLERKYKEAGIAFVRYTTPGLLIVGTGAAAAFASGPIFVMGSATAGASAAATISAATLVALPLYYGVVLAINHHNKVDMEQEFNRRRLALPITLAPGETRTGSFFFPMVPNPRSLSLSWTAGDTPGVNALPLDFLHGLHAAPAASK